MRNVYLVLASAMVLGFGLGCEKKLDTDLKKASYAIGQQIGSNLKNQNIEIDPEILAASIKDAAGGKESKLKPEEMQAALMKLQENMNKKQQEAGEKNLAEGKAFLEKNKGTQGVVQTASGLQYQIITEGTGKMPNEKDVVKVHYKGTLLNGQQFDSSYDRGQPAEFPVSGVIKGWTEALLLFKVGTKAKLFIPADLAYGPNPRPGIPANSVLIFEVELMDIVAQTPPAGEKKKGK